MANSRAISAAGPKTSWRSLESCVLRPGWLRRPLRGRAPIPYGLGFAIRAKWQMVGKCYLLNSPSQGALN
jgi:hypothetical protein